MKKTILVIALMILGTMFLQAQRTVGGLYVGGGMLTNYDYYGQPILFTSLEVSTQNAIGGLDGGAYIHYTNIFDSTLGCLSTGISLGTPGFFEVLIGIGLRGKDLSGLHGLGETELHCGYFLDTAGYIVIGGNASDYGCKGYVGMQFGITNIVNAIAKAAGDAANEERWKKFYEQQETARLQLKEDNAKYFVTLVQDYEIVSDLSIDKLDDLPPGGAYIDDYGNWGQFLGTDEGGRMFQGKNNKIYRQSVHKLTLQGTETKNVTCSKGVTNCSESNMELTDYFIRKLDVDATEQHFPKGITDPAYEKITVLFELATGWALYCPLDLGRTLDVQVVDGKVQDGDYKEKYFDTMVTLVDGKVVRVGSVGNCISYRNTHGHAYKEISTKNGQVTYKYFDYVDADTGYVWDGVVHRMENK